MHRTQIEEMTEVHGEVALSSFERLMHAWLILDLTSIQKNLDAEGLEIQEFQKSSLISRKELASKTKGFKKLPSEAKLEEINPLLKLYQNEIDSLTKKNKSIETIFFNIYRAISDAPDPKPLLENGMKFLNQLKEVDSLKLENLALKGKLLQFADYELVKLQNSNLSAQFEAKISNKEKEMFLLFAEKEKNWAAKESKYEETVKECNKEIEELKTSQQVMELKLNHQSDLFDDKELNSRASSIIELEMVQRDAESSKLRVLQLEKRNEELSRELSVVKNSDTANDKIEELTVKNLQLSAKLEHEQSSSNELKREHSTETESLKIEIRQLQNETDTLKLKLTQMSDYDELKKELEVLKQIEFGDDNNDESNNLDSIIIQTNRKLNNDIVEYRSKNEALSKKIYDLEESNKNLNRRIDQLALDNLKLENDLSNMNGSNDNGNNNNWDAMSMISSVSKTTKNGRLSPLASIAGSLIETSSTFGNENSTNSILPIITQQRDRFRVRNKELEEDLKQKFSKIVELKREVASLKNDNKELYERIRYISSYSSANQQEKKRNTQATAEFKYEEDYERDLHPIEQFRLKESQRINSRISPVERIYITMIRFILSSSLSRYLFALYCLGLHLVIVSFFIYTTNLHMDITADITEGSTGGMPLVGGDTVVDDFIP